MGQKIILDTDIGDDIDDAIALSFAARRPEIELLAVTTCHVCTRERGRMAAKQLMLLGAEGLPYAPGPALPLTPVDEATREKFRARRPFEYDFVGDEEEVYPPACDEAVDLLYDTICAHAGEVILVTIGPLTNVGVLFRQHPDAQDKLKAVAMMAGDYPGGRIEYNMACDPVASRIVLGTRTPKFLGTYAVTSRVVMREAEMEALRASDDPACRGLARQIELWWPHRGGRPGPVVYDVCPVLWSFEPSWFRTRTCRVDVLVDGPERGRNVERQDATPIDVSVDIDEAGVLALLMKTLLGR